MKEEERKNFGVSLVEWRRLAGLCVVNERVAIWGSSEPSAVSLWA